MSQYPNPERVQEGQGYAGGYQSQPLQQPQQPYYPPPQPPMPGYAPQGQPMAYPQQQMYPQGQMMMPQQMPYQQPMMQPMMAPQMNVQVNVGNQQKQQLPAIVRIIYFLCIGMYIGMAWAGLALFLCCTIIGLPFGLLMLNQLPAVMTLKM